MARRNPGSKVTRVRKKVQPLAKKRSKRPQVKKTPSRKKKKKRAVRSKQRKKRIRKPRIGKFTVVPRSWKKLSNQELERMTVQIVQRIGEKIVGGGHAMRSVEAKILKALIAAEQRGDLNAEFYEQAGRYDGYDSPQDVYQLWLYSGT